MKKLLFVIIALICNTIYAEGISSNISGTVSDAEKKPIPYVKVTLDELGIYTTNNESGIYNFINIPAGSYHITFSKTGFISKTLSVNIKNPEEIFDAELEKSLIETATIEVTSSFEAQDVSESTFSIAVINEKNLFKSKEQVLSSTISGIPGVNAITTGIGIGKPVIRGLSSLSVLIIHDGVKQETQQWGDEHSPEISLYDLDRIEILRGPASLLYGADGIGGVVNILTKPLIFSTRQKPVYYGQLDLGGFSVNNQTTGNLMLGLGLKNFSFKGHMGYRNSGDVKTPDGTLLINTLHPGIKDTITGGRLSNSGNKEFQTGMSFGLSGDFGIINAGFENFNRELRMHDADPVATGNQKLNTSQFELSGNFNLSSHTQLESVFSFQDHTRKEFESTEDKENNLAFLNWKLNTFQGDIRLHQDLTKSICGTIGVSLTKGKNESIGINKLIPNFSSTSFGIYTLEKYNSEKWSFSAGGRFDTKTLEIRETIFDSTKTLNPQSIKFNAFSGSIGGVFRPNKNLDIFTNIGRGWRAPSEYELFVDGEHEGTSRVERGILTLNPSSEPAPESSLNFDLGIRIRYKGFNGEISLFNNFVNDFLYPAPTNTVDSSSMLPVFEIRQSKSTFRGIEYSFQFQPLEFLLLSWSGDYLATKNDATGSTLPFTPPAKNILEIKLQKSNLWKLYNPYFSIKAKFVAAQDKTDLLETKTDAYTLVNIGTGFDLTMSKYVMSIDFSVDNLLDTKYVDHLSRYKSFAMNPGRSFNLKISVPFEF
ncbi:MAG: TonB-dependent receptor [Ignavibacteriae bacterium]|nr:TonB-dependent receptor [Ignavibacteriota bacterium]